MKKKRFWPGFPPLLIITQLMLPGTISAQSLEVKLVGADRRLEENILAHVSFSEFRCDMGMRRLNRQLPAIQEQVIRAGRALGYYQLNHQIEFAQADACWELIIEVEPGEPVTIGSVNLDIASNNDLFSSLLDELSVVEGDQLNQSSYEQLKSSLSAQAIENGFFDARFNRSQLLLDLQRNLASVEIDFDPGPRYRFSAVQVEEIDVLSVDFIQRYINFEPGEFYSSEKLVELRNALNDSQYFSNVSVTPLLDQAAGNAVPLRVSLDPRPRRAYTAGVGVTTDIGPRVRLDYADRYRNPAGHSFFIQSAVSPVQQLLDFNYTLPMRDPTTESLRFSAGFFAEDNDTFESVSGKLGANYSYVNRFDWVQNIFLNYLHEEFSIAEEDEVADLLIPGVNISRTQADDALYPERGWYLFAQARGASTSMISTETFLQFQLTGKWLRKMGPGRLILKFDAGTTIVDDGRELPVSLRFFAGGDQSVRGYKYQSLGPVDELEEVIGGKHLLSAGIEYDFNILPDWKLAVFLDAGNSFTDFDDYDLAKGAGIGVRWLSPIGPVRVDLASALDNDNKLRLHVTMGPDI